MQNQGRAHNFFSNLFFAFLAQGVSLLLSLLLTLVVSKLLGVTDFAYWQLFLFYGNYVGLTQFGLIDGIYLRLGGKKYEELDFPLLKSQLLILVTEQAVVGMLLAAGGWLLESDPNRQFVWMMTAVYVFVFNLAYYFGYIFQATNNTRYFSISIILDRMLFITCVVLLLLFKRLDYHLFISLYVVTKTISFFYCIIMGRKIVAASLAGPRQALLEAWRNVSVGINLLLANMAGMFVLGSGRLVVDSYWGIESFGKFSFALSLINFFLTFLQQISMVLFPVLRQVNDQNLKSLYSTMNKSLSYLFFGICLFYNPIRMLLGIWIPQYQDSLMYLGILLPICIYDGKMQMLCNTYLKVLRKERMLLVINLLSCLVSVSLSLFGAYVLHNMLFVVLCMVVAIAFRSIFAEVYLGRLLDTPVVKDLIWEVVFSSAFMLLALFIDKAMVSSALYALLYLFYLAVTRKDIRGLIAQFRSFR